MTTAAEWATLLRDAVVDHYTGLGYDVIGRIGNPAVAGTFSVECGPEVHVDHGAQGQNVLYRTVDPWPTQLQDINKVGTFTTAGSKLAADFTVRVIDCVPQRDDAGRLPDDDSYAASVENMQTLFQGLFDALSDAQDEWRKAPDAKGYMHFDPIEAIPRQGLHAGFEVRVVCEVC